VSDLYSVQRILELSCAAQRTNKSYIKESENVFDSEGKFLFVKHTNKELVKWALGINRTNIAIEFAPIDIFVQDVDKELAIEIRNYFKRLMFSAIKGDNEFQTEVNSLLNTEDIPADRIGYIACLPSVMVRDQQRLNQTRRFKDALSEPLGDPGDSFVDLDCEIVSAKRSENFDAWNICAIINNKIVSWFSRIELKTGPCVVVKAKVKSIGENWHTKKIETRLNYVKAAQ